MKKRFSRNTNPIIKYSYHWGLTLKQMEWIERLLELELLKPREIRGFVKDWTGIDISRGGQYRVSKQIKTWIPLSATGSC
jgi:hypothetical protein